MLIPDMSSPRIHEVRDLAARRARVLREVFAFENSKAQRDPQVRAQAPVERGRRENRVPVAPAASVCKVKKAHELVTTGSTGITRLSLRNGFNGFLRALPGDRAFLPPSPA